MKTETERAYEKRRDVQAFGRMQVGEGERQRKNIYDER